MNNGLSGIKNIIWALAIVIALLALLVGLIFSVAARNYSDAPDGTLVLSSGSQAVDSRGSGLDADPYSPIVGGGTLKELPSTQDGGLEYVFGMTYLCNEDCKGLCRSCGCDRNETVCSCGAKQADPRMAVLAKLLEGKQGPQD